VLGLGIGAGHEQRGGSGDGADGKLAPALGLTPHGDRKQRGKAKYIQNCEEVLEISFRPRHSMEGHKTEWSRSVSGICAA
jgi:hypothetical protein